MVASNALMVDIPNNKNKQNKEINADNPISYTNSGIGSPIILVHGVAASQCDWSALLPALAKAQYSAYALDLLGHGESYKSEDPNDYHIESIYRTFDAWVGDLNLSEPVCLVGHSLGGYLSLLYALRRPDRVRGIVLIDPLFTPNQLSPVLRLLRRRPALGARVMQRVPVWLVDWVLGWDPTATANFSQEARRQIADDYKRASPNFVYITQDIPDLTPALRQVNTPTLIIWGAKDLTLHPSSFPELVRSLSNARGHKIDICGHQPHIGQPSIVNQLILEFFDSLRS